MSYSYNKILAFPVFRFNLARGETHPRTACDAGPLGDYGLNLEKLWGIVGSPKQFSACIARCWTFQCRFECGESFPPGRFTHPTP
jgi:hypothetical protein